MNEEEWERRHNSRVTNVSSVFRLDTQKMARVVEVEASSSGHTSDRIVLTLHNGCRTSHLA